MRSPIHMKPAALALIVVLWFTAALQAQQDDPVFRSTSELVLTDVQVLHKKTGTAAAALRAQDLRVFEDGVEQQIVEFSRDELPLSVVLLFDLTASVHAVLKPLAAGARAALGHLKPEDEVAVMVYAAQAQVVDGFSTDRDRTVEAIAKASAMTSKQAAFFNEAVYQAAAQLHSATPTHRRAIIWLTDNWPNVAFTRAVHTEQEAIRKLNEEGVAVAPILMKDWKFLPVVAADQIVEGPARRVRPPGDAKKYAELTGGQALSLGGKKAEERLAEMIDQLRSRYTVGYRPSVEKPSGTYCTLRVELAPNGALRADEWAVLARRGYYRKP